MPGNIFIIFHLSGYQSVPRFNYPDLDLIVWTFQLERHDESEERLDPIPVEPFYP